MRQAVQLLWRRAGLSLAEAMHDRFDFLVESLMQLGVVAINVVFFTVLYQHVETLGGWTYHGALLVLGLYQIVDGLSHLFLYNNVRRIPKLVRHGQLDAVLVQPIDPQLNLIRRLDFAQAGTLIVSFGLLGFAARQLALPFLPTLLVGGLFVSLGFLLHWAAIFGINTLGFWLVRNDNLIHVVTRFLELAKVPISAYGRAASLGLTFLVPLAVVATLPAELLLDSQGWSVALIASTVVLLLFVASRQFFFLALRSYNSASG